MYICICFCMHVCLCVCGGIGGGYAYLCMCRGERKMLVLCPVLNLRQDLSVNVELDWQASSPTDALVSVFHMHGHMQLFGRVLRYEPRSWLSCRKHSCPLSPLPSSFMMFLGKRFILFKLKDLLT